MAKMKGISVGSALSSSSAMFRSKWVSLGRTHLQCQIMCLTIRASHSEDEKNDFYKQLGLYSLRKKIDDAVMRAEMLGPVALELEEARRVKQEETLRQYDLWDDVAKSDEVLIDLADATKIVNSLKDLRYKAEEAKLITQLAGMDVINYRLFKQAYNTSVDMSKFLDQYETSKLLSEPYDTEGACVIIKAGSEGVDPEMWAEQLLSMYLKWAEKEGYKGRIVEKFPSKDGGIKLATLEFESEYAYGYLSGERGAHRMIRSSNNGSIHLETSLADVDVIPLFLETSIDLQLDDKDLVVSSFLPVEEDKFVCQTEPAVSIQHIPSGVTVQSSGERSHFANKLKALNRLKAKLLVIAMDQGVCNLKDIKIDAVSDMLHQDTRRYIFHPHKLVQDVKTGIQLSDLNSVLDGNIQSLIGANISIRRLRETV